jgi:hypothetical protein
LAKTPGDGEEPKEVEEPKEGEEPKEPRESWPPLAAETLGASEFWRRFLAIARERRMGRLSRSASALSSRETWGLLPPQPLNPKIKLKARRKTQSSLKATRRIKTLAKQGSVLEKDALKGK